MDPNTQYNSPQPENAVVASAAKHNKRNRNRKSNNLQQAAGQVDNGDVSDSPNLSASPASAAQQTPKPKTRHASTTVKHTNSPRGKPHNAQPATPLKREEYAGAQFFASSPAPGSLPLPKFFRSTIAPTVSPDRAVQDEVELPAADSPSKAPTKTQPITLDRFFAADRRERANKDSQARQDEQARRSQVQPAFPRDLSNAEAQVRQFLSSSLILNPTSSIDACQRKSHNVWYQYPKHIDVVTPRFDIDDAESCVSDDIPEHDPEHFPFPSTLMVPSTPAPSESTTPCPSLTSTISTPPTTNPSTPSRSSAILAAPSWRSSSPEKTSSISKATSASSWRCQGLQINPTASLPSTSWRSRNTTTSPTSSAYTASSWRSSSRSKSSVSSSSPPPTPVADHSLPAQTAPRQPPRSPFGNSLPQQQLQSPYGARAEDRPFNGQIANSEPTSKDTKAMADDLKRILKIGNFS